MMIIIIIMINIMIKKNIMIIMIKKNIMIIIIKKNIMIIMILMIIFINMKILSMIISKEKIIVIIIILIGLNIIVEKIKKGILVLKKKIIFKGRKIGKEIKILMSLKIMRRFLKLKKRKILRL